MKNEEQARSLFGISLSDRDLKGNSFLFALLGSSLVTLTMAFVRFCLTACDDNGCLHTGLRRKYAANEYISAILLVVGLILFTLADALTSLNFSVIGVVMVTGAIVMDSFLGNLQEAIFSMNPETTQMEMLFCSTVVGLPFMIPHMLLTGGLFKAWNSCSQHLYVYGVLVFEAMVQPFIGQVSVLSLIAIFAAATTAMVHYFLSYKQGRIQDLKVTWADQPSINPKDYFHFHPCDNYKKGGDFTTVILDIHQAID